MARKRNPVAIDVPRQVEEAAAVGLTDAMIAKIINISERTLRRHLRDALDRGRARGNHELAKTLHYMATVERNPACLIFASKVRLHMRERDDAPQAPMRPSGVLLMPAPMTVEDWEKASIEQQTKLIEIAGRQTR